MADENQAPQVPFLPGYLRDPSIRTDFRKRHHFELAPGGVPLEHDVPLGNIDANKVGSGADVNSLHGAMLRVRPAWLEHAGRVARFFAYQVNFRFVRRFAIYYYLEDNSMSIGEVPDRNRLTSGPPARQATFLRRHRVPVFGSADRIILATDLDVGRTITIYSRQFYIYDCDDTTRRLYQTLLNVALQASQEAPVDTEPLAAAIPSNSPSRLNEHLEALHGRPTGKPICIATWSTLTDAQVGACRQRVSS